MSVHAVIAGGGTAGHVLPGIAIAKALVARGHRADQIVFVGSSRGVETALVPDAGFALTALPGRGIQRRLTPANLGAVAGLIVAVWRSVMLVRRLRPRVVVALGGYASVACVVGAIVWRVPIVIAEQNAVPGLANRLAGRFARAAAVSFPDTGLPREVVTGNPVREEILSVNRATQRESARAQLGLPAESVVIGVFGGSLGARRINDAVIGMVERWSGPDGVAIHHVVGRRDFPELVASGTRLPPDGLVYQAVEYQERMDLVYAAADLVVCRAGATTVAELGVVGIGAVLVPLPGAPGDHQTANAAALVEAGAAVLVPDSELDADRLDRELNQLVDDPDRLEAMASAAGRLGRRDAAERVATLVDEHAGE